MKAVETSKHPDLDIVRIPFTQTELYSRWREVYGTPMIKTRLEKDGETIGFAQWLFVSHMPGVGCLYAPHGPCYKEGLSTVDASHGLRVFGEKISAAFVRVDCTTHLKKQDVRPASSVLRFSYMQPREEWRLSLKEGYGAVAVGIKKRTSRCIKTAQKMGVEVRMGREYRSDCIECIEKTAHRKGFNPHPRAYYDALFDALSDAELFVLCAYHKNQCVASGCFVVHNNETLFLFGGSDNTAGDTFGSYMLQDAAIREAVQRKCTIYNFGGMSSNNDSLSGVTLFKKGFGGYEARAADPHDMVLNPLGYTIYNGLKYIQSFL